MLHNGLLFAETLVQNLAINELIVVGHNVNQKVVALVLAVAGKNGSQHLMVHCVTALEGAAQQQMLYDLCVLSLQH